mmetsp:Transcript_13720/g.24866  ORF Transcript_13720/g.24866 Transcript_13720/m.24866 type:complete len:82 (+) Transcript_13720:706-951(+)
MGDRKFIGLFTAGRGAETAGAGAMPGGGGKMDVNPSPGGGEDFGFFPAVEAGGGRGLAMAPSQLEKALGSLSVAAGTASSS